MTTMYPGWYGLRRRPRRSGRCRRGSGEPGWTMWPRRIWPIDPLAVAPRRMLFAAALAGAIGTALWRPTVLSVGYLVVGLMVFGVVYGTADRRPTRAEWIGIGLTLALLSVSAVLAAEWVGGLCLIAAWVVGWCTLAGGHTWTAVFTGPFLPWLLPGRVRGWVGRALHGPATSRIALPKLGRAAAVVGVTVVLALVFGGLFAAADPAFAHLVDNLVPDVRWRRHRCAARGRGHRGGLRTGGRLPDPVQAAAGRHGTRADAAGAAVGMGGAARRARRAVHRLRRGAGDAFCSAGTPRAGNRGPDVRRVRAAGLLAAAVGFGV